jgi:hypothetical protein
MCLSRARCRDARRPSTFIPVGTCPRARAVFPFSSVAMVREAYDRVSALNAYAFRRCLNNEFRLDHLSLFLLSFGHSNLRYHKEALRDNPADGVHGGWVEGHKGVLPLRMKFSKNRAPKNKPAQYQKAPDARVLTARELCMRRSYAPPLCPTSAPSRNWRYPQICGRAYESREHSLAGPRFS